MRRQLAVILFLCSCTVAAQTDQRAVRTVQIDVAPEEPEPEQRTDPAEHPDERIVLARQLVALSADGAGDATCVPSKEVGADLAAAYRARPGDFHGISPQSAYWPEVKRAWHAARGDRCANPEESPAAILARSYAEHLSTAELRQVLAFQESAAGRAFIAATEKARADLDQELSARGEGDEVAGPEAFERVMLRLKTRYERDPK